MTVQSNLLMSSLVQARISCSRVSGEVDSLDTSSSPIHWPSQILSIKPPSNSSGASIPTPVSQWRRLFSPADPPALSCALPAQGLSTPHSEMLHFHHPSVLAKSPTRFARDSWDCRGSAERFCLPPLLAALPLVCPSPCFYLEFLPLLPLPLAASSCSLCALDSFVPLFRNTL